jgi:RimJ/RimL family protein N-acetyltransferase
VAAVSAPPAELRFRAFRASDAQALVSWARTPDELLQWAGPRFRFPLDVRQLAAYADTTGEDRHVVSAVAARAAVVGHLELTVLPEHELGRVGCFGVAPRVRGQGVGTRLMRWLIAFAFDELSLHRLELDVFSFNEPARRLYTHAGFRQEGLSWHARKASAGRWDLIHMGLLESWRRPGRA